MGEFDLNLSTRPFPAYKLKSLLLTIALVLLIALSAYQGYAFLEYSEMSGQIRNQARSAQVDSEALGRQLAQAESQLNRPEAAAKLSEIEFLNDIISRKLFSWTRMFSTLEELMPDSVHLVSLSPTISKGVVMLHMDLYGRSISDIKGLIVALQASPLFDEVRVSYDQNKEGTAFNAPPSSVPGEVQAALVTRYHPEREGQ